MGVHILSSNMGSIACMYCSTTDWAFGPVFGDTDTHSAEERIEFFLKWLVIDPRRFTDNELDQKYQEWRVLEPELWKKEEEEQEKKYLEDLETDGVN